jgi:diguanylate cyclase (GGDEF)-like protein
VPSERILIVEDDAGVRGLVQRRVAAAGYAVTAVASGLEAIAAIEREQPDLVLMDIAMPGMDGVEVCQRVVERWPAVAVVFLTAHGEIEERVRALDAGGRDLMLKPFAPPELLARVRATLREKALRDAAEHRAETFERLALTDTLSGLRSRAYLDARLPEEIMRANRYRRPLACLLVDIDDFKRLNDTRGHAFGDEVIRRVGEILQRDLRHVDFAARYGGEEFVVVLPETPLTGAELVAERIRAAVATAAIGEPPVVVTVSIGVADGGSSDALLRADEALYAAKSQGKNRVIVWSGG